MLYMVCGAVIYFPIVVAATGSRERGHGGREEEPVDQAEPLHRQLEGLHGADSGASGCACEGKRCLHAG